MRSQNFRSPTGFTLMELLVVIGIIVLLVGILLPALGRARIQAKNVATGAQLSSIAKACESYNIAFGAYPGYMDDAYLSGNDDKFTATENLLVSLMGRVEFNPANTTPAEKWFELPTGTNYWVDIENIGSGPMSNTGQIYGAFYPAKSEEIAVIEGVAGGATNDNSVPEFVDVSYGMPILYFKARGGWERPASPDATTGSKGAFVVDHVQNYVDATELKNPRGLVQGSGTSVLHSSNANRAENLAWLTINPKLSNLTASGEDGPNDNTADVPGGAFYLTATGYDRVYFDAETVGGSIEQEEELRLFDDIIESGGTAP